MVLFIVLFKEVQGNSMKSVGKILKFHHSNKSYCVALYFDVYVVGKMNSRLK